MPLKSSKTLVIAVSALAIGTAVALPSLAAPADPADAAAAAPAVQLAAADQPADPGPGARPLPLRAQILFNLVDKNGDGAITQDEFTAFETAIFNAVDTNKDGKLTPGEFDRITGLGGMGPRPPMAMQFQRDGHGMGHRPGFFRFGPNGPRMQPGPMGPDQQGQLQDDQRPDAGPGGQPQDFASLDTNGDGAITPDEFAAGGPVSPPVP